MSISSVVSCIRKNGARIKKTRLDKMDYILLYVMCIYSIQQYTDFSLLLIKVHRFYQPGIFTHLSTSIIPHLLSPPPPVRVSRPLLPSIKFTAHQLPTISPPSLISPPLPSLGPPLVLPKCLHSVFSPYPLRMSCSSYPFSPRSRRTTPKPYLNRLHHLVKPG